MHARRNVAVRRERIVVLGEVSPCAAMHEYLHGRLCCPGRKKVERFVLARSECNRPVLEARARGFAQFRVASDDLQRVLGPAALVEIAVELGLRVMQEDFLFHVQMRSAALYALVVAPINVRAPAHSPASATTRPPARQASSGG